MACEVDSRFRGNDYARALVATDSVVLSVGFLMHDEPKVSTALTVATTACYSACKDFNNVS
jgi:hypothetical protein